MEKRNTTPMRLCNERVKPLLEDVHDAKYVQNGAQVTFNRYATAIGKTAVIEPHHPEHKEVTRMALSDLDTLIAHHRRTEEAMQKVHASLEKDYAEIDARQKSGIVSRVKSIGSAARKEKRDAAAAISESKKGLHEHQAGIFQMMKAQEYLKGITIR